MKKRYLALIGVVIIAGVVLISNIKSSEPTKTESKLKPVKTITLTEADSANYLEYTGITTADVLKKLSFKSSGRIAAVLVEKGQKISPGMILAKLDPIDLQLAVSSSKAQMDMADSQYNKALNGATPEEVNQVRLTLDKASNAYKFSKSNYEKFTKLYKEGVISSLEMEKIQLDFEVREAELKQASEAYKQIIDGTRSEDKRSAAAQLEQARTDYRHKQNLLADSVLKSDVHGYVVDVLYERGEMVSAGYPIIIIRNEQQLVQVGLSQIDLLKVKSGMEVDLSTTDFKAKGVITNIAQLPDEVSRTYTVDIVLKDSQILLPLGAVLNVQIEIGNNKGIWIPIAAVLTSQDDFVFVVENGKAEKRLVQIGDVKNNLVKVTGLKKGEQLVIEGFKRLTNGDRVRLDLKERKD